MSEIKNMNEGFVKALTLIVVGICVLFIVFAGVSRYVGPQAGTLLNLTKGVVPTSGTSATGANGLANTGTNPLLKFLDEPSQSLGGSYDSSVGASNNISDGSRSPYAGQIYLGGGNSSYSIQPFEEYVTLQNNGSRAVNVTGWTLTNSKGTRPIQTSSNSYIYPAAESATIGQGTTFLNPSGVFQIGPIILLPGDNAIVTTGQPFSQFPFSIYTSFKENICEGYLKDYPFEPQLSYACPYPTNDKDIRTVTSECYTYMQSLSACEDPQKYDKKNFDQQTSQCKDFMTARLSYPRCVALHGDDSNFTTHQWRIFLGKQREMWASQRETITLYDASGLIVDQISY